jgi:DNA primase large subunit
MNIPAIIHDELKQYTMTVKYNDFAEAFPYFIEYYTKGNILQIDKITNIVALREYELSHINKNNIRFEFDNNKLCEIINNILENCNLDNEKRTYLEIRCLYKTQKISLCVLPTNEISLMQMTTFSINPIIISKEQFTSTVLENLIKKCKRDYVGVIYILL